MRWLRWLRWTLIVIAGCALLAFLGGWWAMHRSLPRIDGSVPAAALGARATIERDARGIPAITASSRADLAYATGYAHAQDRYFQMDLSRRLAAGELCEMFGAVAVKLDTRTRRFGFRAVARQVVRDLGTDERAVNEAYTRGVNAGLASLDARPWEYFLLGVKPREWTPEDSILVVHSMWWQLQYGNITAELERRRLERAAAAKSSADVAHALIAFVYAGHGEWDSPDYGREMCASCGRPLPDYPALLAFRGPIDPPVDAEPKAPGCNNLAVAGDPTKTRVELLPHQASHRHRLS